MLSYITKGRAGTASNQYSDYLLLARDSFSSNTYGMHKPVVTLTTRAAFEKDATAAYQNALVRLIFVLLCHRQLIGHILDVVSHKKSKPCR